ncbi:TetR/AcrR family transcriptional regulator [Nocardia higoensis]|uniref:TetR/AcrR family transcriptional regulator n=1 Tax=Nocardia higoensis TaxID=228599 RepID=UPI0002E84E4C|nr:TetR family transcriptional regulator [Nocardia higoensis]
MTAPLATHPATRADARRNRALVLAAAQRAFAEQGTAVSLAEVARRAGVGAGTVYRHFPAKADLLEAVMRERIDRLAELAVRCLAQPDAGAAFFDFCARVVAVTPRNEALCEFLGSDDGWPRASMQGAAARFHRALGELLAAAQRQGAVRADIDSEDVLGIFTACVAIQRMRGAEGTVDRTAALVLDSLRERPSEQAVTKARTVAATRDEMTERDETAGEQAERCPMCRKQVTRKPAGRRARYCSPACRQKAHRRRVAARAAARTADPIGL